MRRPLAWLARAAPRAGMPWLRACATWDATARPTARAASSRVVRSVARVRLAMAKKSGKNARSMSPARAITIWIRSPRALGAASTPADRIDRARRRHASDLQAEAALDDGGDAAPFRAALLQDARGVGLHLVGGLRHGEGVA